MRTPILISISFILAACGAICNPDVYTFKGTFDVVVSDGRVGHSDEWENTGFLPFPITKADKAKVTFNRTDETIEVRYSLCSTEVVEVWGISGAATTVRVPDKCLED